MCWCATATAAASDVTSTRMTATEKLNCNDTHGDGWEIKAGTSDNEHLVSIEPHGSGTRFGTVLVQTHGKDRHAVGRST